MGTYLIIRNDLVLMHKNRKKYSFNINELEESISDLGISKKFETEDGYLIQGKYLVISANIHIDDDLFNKICKWSTKPNTIKTIEEMIKPYKRDHIIDNILNE